MTRHLDDLEGAVPTLEPGVTRLLDDDERSIAHHDLVLAHLQVDRGQVLWVDARDTASTYALYGRTRNRRLLASIEVARAWTAYQHHTLVRRLVKRATPRTRLLVLPNVCSLYRDDDLGNREAECLLAATLTTVSELADAIQVPALLTTMPSEREALEPYTDRDLTWKRTRHGDTYAGDGFRPTAYRGPWWWQTTIPYWLDMVGATEGRSRPVDPWTADAPTPGQVTLAIGP